MHQRGVPVGRLVSWSVCGTLRAKQVARHASDGYTSWDGRSCAQKRKTCRILTSECDNHHGHAHVTAGHKGHAWCFERHSRAAQPLCSRSAHPTYGRCSIPALSVASRWRSLKYAGTLMTAFVTVPPVCSSASAISCASTCRRGRQARRQAGRQAGGRAGSEC
eukprot:226478-Chlamydomonas_euryale.AAC.7